LVFDFSRNIHPHCHTYLDHDLPNDDEGGFSIYLQGNAILNKPLNVLMIAVPLVLQNVLTSAFAYLTCQKFKQPHNIAAPAALIGASDFFELAAAVAITLFGAVSPVVLVTTVGVLTEVPVMLILVKLVNKTKHWFPEPTTES